MTSPLTGAPSSVISRALVASLVCVLLDETIVLWSGNLQENTLAAGWMAGLRVGLSAAAILGPVGASAFAKTVPRLRDVAALLALLLERTAASATHQPWNPARADASREMLVATASFVSAGIPWGGLGAFGLTAALGFAAFESARANFSRGVSGIFVGVTLLFATGVTLVYATGCGEAWFEAAPAQSTVPCAASQAVLEPPKEMDNGSEKRNPK